MSPIKSTKFDEFRTALADCGAPRARVAVLRTAPADLFTPVSAYLRLRRRSDHGFLFESVQGGERLARYSFVGFEPTCLLRSWGHRVQLEWRRGPRAGQTEERSGDPRSVLRELTGGAQLLTPTPGPRFLGGAVGFFAYDSARLDERVPKANPDLLGTPDLVLGLHDQLVAFDHVHGLLHRIAVVDADPASAPEGPWQQAQQVLDCIDADLRAALPPLPEAGGEGAFRSNQNQEQFEAAVRRAQEHIRAGDIFQVVLSRRISTALPGDAFALYRALRVLSPSPYLFHLDLGEHTLVGASPEMLVRCEDGHLQTLPIAGTRPRGATEEEDAGLAAELAADPKELAEHEMLVDLGRNDLGRVSRYGTVQVVAHRELHRFSHVMHLVSRVTGELAEGKDGLDALYACFPAGTVSGAPKVRAMQLIDELEPSTRGVYAGAVGYLDYRGDLDACIAIRTVVVHQGVAHVQAGAGIVYDSVPSREWDETGNKARALLEAIAMARGGLPDLSRGDAS